MPAPRLKPVSEQVIVITGASSGIGLATARAAAERGAAVVIAARNEAALNEIAQEIRSKGGRAQPVVADVADMQQVERIAETAISAFGGFDSWCNVAGAFIYGETEDVPLDDHRRLFDVTYWGVVHGTLVAARHLKERGGAIVNVGSVLSDRAIALQGPYCAAKFAVKGITDSFRMEFLAEGYPISVTLVKPGPIDTPYMEHARNLTGAPGTRNPPPAYHPRVVARGILHACEHRVRDLTVGGGGLAVSLMGNLMPGLTDFVMSKIARPMQVTEETGREERRDNLYAPREDLAETSSLSGPPPRQTSLLLEAQMNPLGTTGLLFGAAALITGAAIGMATIRRERQKTAPRRFLERMQDRLDDTVDFASEKGRRLTGYADDAYGTARQKGRSWAKVADDTYEAASKRGRKAARDADDATGGLLAEIGRIATRALDFAETAAGTAAKTAAPYAEGAAKTAGRYADRAARYASSVADEARDRGKGYYDDARDRADDARDRGWSLFGRARREAQDRSDDARERSLASYARAKREAEARYRDAEQAGSGLLERIAAALRSR
ncbi:SDR family oxidoreductase [Roseomonas sp. CCTCC AB2023176]|uniref:SDR family oxidoreductase n=1 Tax=Roseomonas sp. CCTCC AB2023176 TaxID=3342640 RepID=UPI0035D9DCC1